MLRRLACVLAAGLALAACDIDAEITNVEKADWRPATEAPESWDAVFADPVPIEVRAFVTGEVLAGAGILIDPEVEGVPAEYKEDIWVPSVAFLVQHPMQGNLLLDAGLRAGDCAYSVLMVITIECRNVAGADPVSQLAREKIEKLDYLLISHFHGDHASGLGPILGRYEPVVLTTDAELEAVRSPMREASGYKADQLTANMKVETADAAFFEMPILGKVADLYGDGSLWLVSTPGHTAGHLSVLLNTTAGPKLLTFDAAHLAPTYEHNAPGDLGYDVPMARDSIARLKAFAEAYPEVDVIFGHEPTQWPDDEINVLVARGVAAPDDARTE